MKRNEKMGMYNNDQSYRFLKKAKPEATFQSSMTINSRFPLLGETHHTGGTGKFAGNKRLPLNGDPLFGDPALCILPYARPGPRYMSVIGSLPLNRDPVFGDSTVSVG